MLVGKNNFPTSIKNMNFMCYLVLITDIVFFQFPGGAVGLRGTLMKTTWQIWE